MWSVKVERNMNFKLRKGAFQNVAGGNLTGLPCAVHRDLLGFSGYDILECTPTKIEVGTAIS
jgi:hypothetical protein